MHSDSISNRGTSTAIHEYATFLSSEGHSILWAYDQNNFGNNTQAIRYFENFHNLVPYKDFQSLAKSRALGFDWAYFLKRGNNDGLIIPDVPNNIHVVFNYYQPHGDQYAYISEWLANYAGRQSNKFLPSSIRHKFPLTIKKQSYVPHCVNIPPATESLRNQWGIPDDSRVCLRYGGFDTFDIPWVKSTIVEILERFPDYYFVGINTEIFTNHPRAIFLPAILSVQEKANALYSSDVFLHARIQGESFGLSIVEAIQGGLRTLVWKGGWDRNHLRLVPKSDVYATPDDLFKKLSMVGASLRGDYLNPVGENFRPKNVMTSFKEIFKI
jgi:hypothetical protein